jgi:hypothetical protein
LLLLPEIVNGSSCTAGSVHSIRKESLATSPCYDDNETHDDILQKYNSKADTLDDSSFCASEDDWRKGLNTSVRLPRNASSAVHLECVTKNSKLAIQILMADITKLTSDGIVNAANGRRRNFGGVARAISDAAGPELQLECSEYIEKYGTIKTTGVMHTCSGRLRSRTQFVIHAVGPVYDESQGQQHCKALLEKTFFNVFKYEELGIDGNFIPRLIDSQCILSVNGTI